MKHSMAAIGWALLFATCGGLLLVALGWLSFTPRHAPPRLLMLLAGIGAAEALVPWAYCLCFALLPGALPAARPSRPLGLKDAIGALLCAVLLMVAAGALTMLPPLNRGLLAGLHTGRLSLPDFNTPFRLQSIAIAGDLTLALWLSWLMRRFDPAVSENGNPTGIGWRSASRRDYGLALALAAILIGIVMLTFHILPPDTAKLKATQAAKLLSGTAVALVAILATVFLLAPIVEEILFRGVIFAGIAAKWGAVWASLLSSLLFIAAHAPEKIHYWPGFLDVGLLALAACWLRLRCRSIRPGILLHVAYNTGLLLTAPLLH